MEGSPSPAPPGVILSSLRANGITHRIATSGLFHFDDAAGVNAEERSSDRRHPPKQTPNNNSQPPNHDLPTTSKKPINEQQKKPLVMLLHGWPESWYSWRHQLHALSLAGYPCCAPDMRGYGGTDSPSDVSSYTIDILAKDVIEIAKALVGGVRGREQRRLRFVCVGHDLGSYLAWHISLLYPESVIAICGMSVPYVGHSPRNMGTISKLRRTHGDCINGRREEKVLNCRYHYKLFHNLPYAAEEYDRNGREMLYRLYSYKVGVECEGGTPEVTDRRMFPPGYYGPRGAVTTDDEPTTHTPLGKVDENHHSPLLDARSAPGLWLRLPRPKHLPSWLDPTDMEYFVGEYQRRGFGGGLMWYRALDLNWELTKHLAGRKVTQPALFLAGQDDDVIRMYGGADTVKRRMEDNCDNLRMCIFYEDAGHWIQQERWEGVNRELLSFLESLQRENEGHLSSKL